MAMKTITVIHIYDFTVKEEKTVKGNKVDIKAPNDVCSDIGIEVYVDGEAIELNSSITDVEMA